MTHPSAKRFCSMLGPFGKPAVIVLHGSCSNSAFMTPELTSLSKNFDVYAVDIIGEAGNSDDRRPSLHADSFALWLREVLDILKLDHTAIVGNSLGGWIALKFTTQFPERVSSLSLIASGGLSDTYDIILNKAKRASSKSAPLKMNASISGTTLPKEVEDFINLILEVYQPITERLPVFTDNDLSRLDMPILFVAGEQDAILDAAAAASRVRRILPKAEVNFLPNTGHMILNAVEFVKPFLEKVYAV